MNRRRFIIEAGKAFPVMAGAIYLVGCDSTSSESDNPGNGNPQYLTVSSTTNSGHSHTLSLPLSDLESTSAKTYDSSNSGGHIHMVTLSSDQLGTISGGSAVTVTSTNDAGHTHQFTFQLS